MTIAEQIRVWREAAETTQVVLAHGIGVSVRTLQNWEAGHGSPSVQQAVAIARALRVAPEEWASLAGLP